jgi:hypothetical protein
MPAMKTHHVALEREGIYHLRLEARLSPEHEAWLDRTCLLIERFVTACALSELARPVASLTLHAASETLFERLGPSADFGKLDPGAFMAQLARSVPHLVGHAAGVLATFYDWLGTTGELDPRRARYLSCYFATLLELHGQSVLPERTLRRATATLARHIAEARICCEKLKRSAA